MVFPVAMKRELRLTFQNTLDLRMVYASVREYVFEILASQIRDLRSVLKRVWSWNFVLSISPKIGSRGLLSNSAHW